MTFIATSPVHVALPAKETLQQLIRRALEESRDEALRERVGGQWTATSSTRLLERAENLACAIRDAGLKTGDRVALIARDCVDWIVCDFATFFAGCVVVPIYPTQALDITAYILEHSEAKLIFADTSEIGEGLRTIGNALPPIVLFQSESRVETSSDALDGLSAFEARGAAIRAQHPELPQAYENGITPDDLAVLIYTSGTTGQPKGVMLSHDNLGFNARSALIYALEKLQPGDDVLSVLPYSHIYEHVTIYIYLLLRGRYSICHDASGLLADFRDVQPHSMTSVPRIFDRVLDGIHTQAMKQGGLRARLVPWALRVGHDYARAQTFGTGRVHSGNPNPWLRVKYAIASRLVLKKIRMLLGLDRLKYFTSGSAALHNDLAMTFLGLGIPIIQGYGLTETSPVITVNRFATNQYGTVGPPIPGVEVQIAEDGEVLTRGRHVMMGYYRDPAATAETIQDGWLHTGDIGELDAGGCLRITDRKKELFKTATGKYVAPARVESAIRRSVFISQAMVVGNSRPHPAALVVPNWDLVCLGLHIPPDTPPEELSQRDDVRAFLTKEVEAQTRDLGSFEQIRRVIILPHELTVVSGELSPSMKIKRRVVEERYADRIDRAYAADLHAQPYV